MKKRLIALLSALVLALGLTVTAWAETPTVDISYLDKNGVPQTKTSTEYTKIYSIHAPASWNAGWYAVFGNVTINGDLGMTGEVHLILKDGSSLTVNGTLGADKLTVYGQSGGTGKLTVTGKTLKYGEFYESRGISANDLTINGGIVTASTVDADTSSVASFGIMVERYITVNGGIVTATSGNGYASSCGIYLKFDLTINGGTVTATGGNSTGESYGVYSYVGNLTLGGSASLTGIGGTANTSYGVYLEGYNHQDYGHATMTSGTLIAKATDTGSNTARAMRVKSFTAPTAPYWWRTEENGAFTKSADIAYVYSAEGGKAYNEITTLDPAPPAAPDAPAHSHTRRQPTATTTEVAPDTTTTTDTVTSAKTFDAGVAVYGVMAVSALLGMGYVGKKRV